MPLRLRSVELQGYKTFASRTLFRFAEGITAIVGPNGSGKSNIADGIRWVLGEQSYLLLRGKKTEDMIFSGSEHRPRLGMAEVTVTFDNSEMWLPLDYSEVELARRAYRDGRNEYLLNGNHVRLRDINEVLAQAGLSERTYTIIGQGLVDASLALRADERRRLFEEAAGIGLYRSRREEAVKHLEISNRNLERVLDILSELEPRLRSLERQARRSIEYAGAQEGLKAILQQWYGYHWHRAQEDLSNATEAVRAEEGRGREAGAAYEQAQKASTAFRERLSGLRGELNAWHRQSAELHRQRESFSRQLAVLEERRLALSAAHESVTADQQRAADEERLAAARLAEAQLDVERLEAQFKEAQGQQTAAHAALHARQSERSGLEEEVLQVRVLVEAANQEQAEARARLDEVRSRLDSLGRKTVSVTEAVAGAETLLRQTDETLQEARAKRDSAESAVAEAEARNDRARASHASLETEKRLGLEARGRLEAEKTRLAAQLEVLEQAEQSLAGYADGARFLLNAARESRLRGTRGALSAALEVPANLETAIAAALGDTLDAVLLEKDELAPALRLLESDGAGRAALLPISGRIDQRLRKPADLNCLGVAAELIRAPDDLRPAVEVMLGQTLIVRDRVTARALLVDLPAHGRIVTLQGEVFRGDGLVIAGKSAASSSLSRPRQKRETVEALASLASRVMESTARIEKSSDRIAESQIEVTRAEDRTRELHLRLDEIQAAAQQAGLEVDSARRQLTWHRTQLEQLQTEIKQSTVSRNALLGLQAETATRASERQARLRVLSGKLAEASLEEPQAQVSYWSTRAAVAEQGLKRCEETKAERNDELLRLQARKSDLIGRSQELAAALSGLETERHSLRERDAELNGTIETLQAQLDPAERDLEQAEQEETRLQAAEASAQRAFANRERELGRLKLDQVRRQDMLNSLREKMLDDFALVMFDYAADIPGSGSLGVERVVEDLPVLKTLPQALEEQLTKERVRLRRMGAINPEAKEEFDRESERHAFLKSQVEDLHQAQADLGRLSARVAGRIDQGLLGDAK